MTCASVTNRRNDLCLWGASRNLCPAVSGARTLVSHHMRRSFPHFPYAASQSLPFLLCLLSSSPFSRSLCLSPFLFSEQHMEYSEQQASSNVITMCHTKPVLTAGGTGGPSTACGVRRKVLNPGAVGAVRGLASLPRRTLPLELPLSVARGGGNHCMSTCCTRRECSERASARPRASELASERLLGNRW